MASLLVVGLPGAGKTTRARELAAARSAVRLTPDEWMIPLYDGRNEPRQRDVVEGRLIWTATQILAAGSGVVLDFGFWGRDERAALSWLAGSLGADCEIVYLAIDRSTQLDRVRGCWRTAAHETFEMTEDELDQWRAVFQEPDAAELAGRLPPTPPTAGETWADWIRTRWPSALG